MSVDRYHQGVILTTQKQNNLDRNTDMKTESQIVEAYKATEKQVEQAWQNVADSGLDYTQDTSEVMEMFESSIEALTSKAIFGALDSCYCDLVQITCSFCENSDWL